MGASTTKLPNLFRFHSKEGGNRRNSPVYFYADERVFEQAYSFIEGAIDIADQGFSDRFVVEVTGSNRANLVGQAKAQIRARRKREDNSKKAIIARAKAKKRRFHGAWAYQAELHGLWRIESMEGLYRECRKRERCEIKAMSVHRHCDIRLVKATREDIEHLFDLATEPNPRWMTDSELYGLR